MAANWMARFVLILATVFCVLPACLMGNEPITGTVKRVTLYRGQALVTRELIINGDAGAQEIVVADLPMSIIDGSLYAESPGKLEVRAVRFRQRAVGEEPREEVRKLDVEISDVQNRVALNQKKTELAAQKISYLDQLQGFVAPTAQMELSKGVLDAETLKQLTQFSFEQRTSVAEEQVQLAKEIQELNQQLELLGRTRAEITSKAQRTVNEAVLFVEKLDGGEQTIQLNYLVSNCGWSPTYSIRAADDRQNVQIEYNALIQQLSGENWESVQLTLSTASPALSASGPSLAPFNVSLMQNQQQSLDPTAGAVTNLPELSMRYAGNRAQQVEFNVQLGQSMDFASKTTVNWTLNKLACDNQQLELINPMEVLSSIVEDVDSGDAPSLSYSIANPVSITSRSDQQMVRIHRGDLASNFYHVATPLLSSYVFREAEVNNGSEIDFLAGPVSVYIDKRFVGRAELPTVAQGETFVLGFGSDAQVRTRRELAEKTEGIQGGNKEVKMKYRILVENYKSSPVKVRVVDRLPFSNRASDIRIAISDPSVPLSSDTTYLRRERTKNILRWDIEVPGEKSGDSAFEIDYAFTLDYDRSFLISDATNEQNRIDEFQMLERTRQKR